MRLSTTRTAGYEQTNALNSVRLIPLWQQLHAGALSEMIELTDPHN